MLTAGQLDAAAAASTASLQEQLRKVQQLLVDISNAQEKQKELQANTKYQIRKMDVGSTTHFHNGLADRIGKRHVVAQLANLLSAVFCRVTQSGLRKEDARGAL